MGINITELNIRTLLSADKYVIPIYQRNYAWGETEVTQLIQDVVDYSQKKKSHDYYIGTLVVFERKTGSSYVFETIDGQQRLTTLTILLSTIKNHYPNITDIDSWYKLNLEFDSRELSTNTLQAIFHANVLNYIDYNTEIMQAYDDSIKALKRILKDNHNSGKRYDEEREVKTFFDYLVNKVIILRVPVPPDTDLNHYFEIMNSRGEQLEKHEILKAKFLEILHQEHNV